MVLRDYTNLKNKQIWGVQRGISPSGLSPLALYADYPFLIRSYAIYKGQGKTLDGSIRFKDSHGITSSDTFITTSNELSCIIC